MQIVAELRFEKIREIGVGLGLNSTVYLARDPQLSTTLAMKEIDKSGFWNTDYFVEAQALDAAAHPNVVQVKYGCETGNHAYIAMPFYEQGCLASKLTTAPLDLATALRIGVGVLNGVAHIHFTGYLHLDLKPSNILLLNELMPLVADFGQARQLSPSGVLTAPPMYWKTFPPEILQTGKARIESDVYLLGLLLYRCVNGDRHFNSQLSRFGDDDLLHDAIIRGCFPDRKDFLPHVPSQVQRVIRKALKVNPAERFNSATAFLDAWGRIELVSNWDLKVDSAGNHVWLGTAPDKCDVQVVLKTSSAKWRVEVYTRGRTIRAKNPKNFWGVFPSRSAALQHLKNVFESL